MTTYILAIFSSFAIGGFFFSSLQDWYPSSSFPREVSFGILILCIAIWIGTLLP
jgi:hypothetical protein